MTERRRASWPMVYAAAWIPFAAVYVAIFLYAGASPSVSLRGTLATVLPYGLLGLLALNVPRLLSWPEARRGRFFAVQALFVLAYAAAGTAGWMGLLALDSLLDTGSIHRRTDPLIIAWQAVIGALVYLSIVGIAYARQNAARVRTETGRAARADALRARAELEALRSQVNPHFLMNTLHTLIGLVRREPALAERALERLGELLHYGLRVHRESVDHVPLREEWRFVSGYLEIEKLRMGDRLLVSLEGDERVMDCLIPPFSLQPLVENAILHGIAPRRDGGRLGVTARRSEDRLHLSVCDDGPGLASSALTSGTGLGLRLLRERLAMLYRDRAELRLEGADERGLRATLDLPVERGRSSEVPVP